MPNIIFNQETKEFHLQNKRISYILCILQNGQLGHLYFGKRVTHRDSFQHWLQLRTCSHTAYAFEKNFLFSLDLIRQEYPCYGTTDYREPAYQMELENGSRITNFVYKGHEIFDGKKPLEGLPGTYAEEPGDACTLEVVLEDKLIQAELELSYTIYENYDVICRSARFINHGEERLKLRRALSASIDFYDSEFEMLQLDGSWARERHITKRKVEKKNQAITSTRGESSAEHNPFLALKRPDTTEMQGDAYGFCLVYSGNFLAQVEVDRFETARVSLGINPFEFTWILDSGAAFQTPEAVLTYSAQGLNGMSQNFHALFNERLVRRCWRNRERPVVLNNWEATYFRFDEQKILEIAEKAKKLGVELFVLDDGWFGKRNSSRSSLGDWYSDREKLPDGVEGLSKKIEAMGLKFGLWFEPEMVNRVSRLYEEHEDWVIRTPGRPMSHGRSQYVLDFSNPEVVDYIFQAMRKILENSKISYIKWDMNRTITEAYGSSLGTDRQGEFFHRYILGVYALYERLIEAFPEILFESCASGGARFDAGLLYYAPQCWASDDTDGVERIKIQYGTSMVYPISSIGAHVSAVPNHQLRRTTPLDFRANVAFFGAFGYELDPNAMTEEEQQQIIGQIQFFKKYRKVFQFGKFYRLQDPFAHQGNAVWMVVSEDRRTAIFSCFKVLASPNPKLKKIALAGLLPEKQYRCSRAGEVYYGDELMNMGFLPEMEFTGSYVRDPEITEENSGGDAGDFTSHLYVFECRDGE